MASKPSGAPSSQGDKKPTLITKPPLTRPRDSVMKQGNNGPMYGKKQHQG